MIRLFLVCRALVSVAIPSLRTTYTFWFIVTTFRFGLSPFFLMVGLKPRALILVELEAAWSFWVKFPEDTWCWVDLTFRMSISAFDPVDLSFFTSFVALSLIKNAPIWTKNSLFWVGIEFFSNRGWSVIDCFFMKGVILSSLDCMVWSDTGFYFY